MPSKKEIRTLELSLRKQFSKEEMQRISHQILRHFKTLDFSAGKVLHVFLPIVHHHEVDTWLLIEHIQIHHPHITIVVSKSDFKTLSLSHYILEKDKLEQSTWGIPEPTAAATPFNGQIDVVLIPLLAFDDQGYRVGYGKGFYDRFLGNLFPKPLRIGICHTTSPIEISDINVFDEKMDLCITPNGILQFPMV